jgi:hypothetical protein
MMDLASSQRWQPGRLYKVTIIAADLVMRVGWPRIYGFGLENFWKGPAWG